jgi:hypothetical protein
MRFSMTIKRLVGAAAAAISVVSLTAMPPASAAPVTLSDTFTVFNLAGDIIVQTTVDESQSPQGSGVFYVVGTSPNTLDAGGFPTVLLEPDGTISDIFGVCIFCGPTGGPAVAFMSDTTVPLNVSDILNFFAPRRIGFRLLETDQPFDATSYLDPNNQAQGYTAQFRSDVFTSDVNATPIPAALPLFASGLGLMGWLSRRRKRNTSALAAA